MVCCRCHEIEFRQNLVTKNVESLTRRNSIHNAWFSSFNWAKDTKPAMFNNGSEIQSTSSECSEMSRG